MKEKRITKPAQTIFFLIFLNLLSYKKVRGWDRRVNWERNGGFNLHYPELYLLEGGYATFYEKYQVSKV